jgi:hypothetical protein
MKKEYEFWANKQNIPHLDLYTKILKLFCGYTGLNFLLGFLYARYWVDFQYNVLFLVLSIISFSHMGSKANDPRKQARDKNAVVFTGIFHGVDTFAVCYIVSFWILLIVYFLEIVHIAMIVKTYYRPRKK